MTRKPIKIDYSPSDFLGGTILLEPLEELAYRRLCDLIYVNGGFVPDDDRLPTLLKVGKRWNRIKERLEILGKLSIESGKITNARCTTEIAKKKSLIERGRSGAEATNARKKKDSDTARPDIGRPAEGGVGRPAKGGVGRPAKGAANGSLPLTHNPILESTTSTTESRSRARQTKPDAGVVVVVANECFSLAGIDTRSLADGGRGDRKAVADWIKAGADPDKHIYPTITDVMRGHTQPDSLRYFTKAITRAVEELSPDEHETANGADETPADLPDDPWACPEPWASSIYRDDHQWWHRLRGYHERGFWLDDWGDPPDGKHPSVPADVLAAFRARVRAIEAGDNG
jgi:uncharacterized protein YdaU (DUF1376 family)